MMDIFAVPNTDASINYLSQVFGNVSGVLCPNGATNCVGGSNSILGTMFGVFNTMILIVAVLMLVYVTVLAVIGTAHEGEFMGKKMNNIWIPIRAFLGVALLVPTGAGYCGIQIIIMWVVVQGIGAANTIWNTALIADQVFGGISNQISVPVVDANSAFQGLFAGLTCSISTNPTSQLPTFDSTSNTYNLGDCGSLTYCNQSQACAGDQANSMSCSACTAQLSVLPQIIQTLSGVAQQLVSADASYQDFFNNSWATPTNNQWQWIYSYCSSVGISRDKCCVRGTAIGGNCQAAPWTSSSLLYNVNDGTSTQSASAGAVKEIYWKFWPQLGPNIGLNTDFIQVAVTYYQNAANQALQNFITSNASNNSFTSSNPIINSAKANGWIFAGALYYQLANSNSEMVRGSVTSLTWSPPSASTGTRNNIAAAQFLAAAVSGDYSQGAATQAAGGGSFNGLSGTLTQPITSNFKTTVTTQPGVNPLLMLQLFGSLLLLIAQVTFLLMVALILAAGTLSDLNVMVLGTGLTNNPTEAPVIMLTVFLVPLFWGAMALMVSIGALLSIYTPLLPFIYFTFGAIAWIIGVIEAMVAGPLVALGIISPSGHHEIMGKAEPAILLLFNLFLRPTLLIFGLMIAMTLALVLCNFVNGTFGYVVLNWLYPIPPSFLTLVFILVAYVMIILAVLNKAFSVINFIPQQVIRWIGGSPESIETPTDSIRGGIESAAGQTGGGMSGVGGRAKELGRDKQAYDDKNKTDTKGDQKDTSIQGKS